MKNLTFKLGAMAAILSSTVFFWQTPAQAYFWGLNGYTNVPNAAGNWAWNMFNSVAYPIRMLAAPIVGYPYGYTGYNGYYPPTGPVTSLHRNMYNYTDTYNTAGYPYNPNSNAPYSYPPYAPQFGQQYLPPKAQQFVPQSTPQHHSWFSKNKQNRPQQPTYQPQANQYQPPAPPPYAPNKATVAPPLVADPANFVNAVNSQFGGNIAMALFNPSMRSNAKSLGILTSDNLFDVDLTPDRVRQIEGVFQNQTLDAQAKIQSVRQILGHQ